MRRFAPLLPLLFIASSASARSHHPARDRHELARGAVVKPEAFRIRSPFPCGVEVKVNCSYGPSSCSPAHRRTQSTSGPNDHYAIDLTRAHLPDNGHDRAIVAVAPGVVLRAGWAAGGWAPYGKIVYIQHAFRDADGHRYQTLYAHLNRVKVTPGQKVRAGQVIGTMGGSSRHRLAKYGPHLHFAMYQDARPTMGGGRAVLPEPMGSFRELRPGMTFISCGDAEPKRVAALEPLPFTPAAGGWMPDDGD